MRGNVVVVIANRVQGPDGRWRTVDSKALHKAAVAMSERYDNVIADLITARLGLDWEYRERGPRGNPAYELSAVPRELVELFSRRSATIEAETDRLVEAYHRDHGRHPDRDTILGLRQQATLSTRPPKVCHSLAELTDQWHRRATAALGGDSATWARTAVAARNFTAI